MPSASGSTRKRCLPRILVRFRLRADADPRFVGAVVESNHYKQWVQRNAGGAAQPNASAKVLGAFPFRLPDEQTQAQVGAVFDAIADLIENNRRRVEALEEMARAVYLTFRASRGAFGPPVQWVSVDV